MPTRAIRTWRVMSLAAFDAPPRKAIARRRGCRACASSRRRPIAGTSRSASRARRSNRGIVIPRAPGSRSSSPNPSSGSSSVRRRARAPSRRALWLVLALGSRGFDLLAQLAALGVALANQRLELADPVLEPGRLLGHAHERDGGLGLRIGELGAQPREHALQLDRSRADDSASAVLSWRFVVGASASSRARSARRVRPRPDRSAEVHPVARASSTSSSRSLHRRRAACRCRPARPRCRARARRGAASTRARSRESCHSLRRPRGRLDERSPRSLGPSAIASSRSKRFAISGGSFATCGRAAATRPHRAALRRAARRTPSGSAPASEPVTTRPA